MSRDLGTVELPNGGGLTVTAYAGPGRGKRLQFTLTQGEGGLTAHGNTDADGVAELVGWLETWLLEQGRRSVPNEVPGPRPATFAISRDRLSRARHMLARAAIEANVLAERLEVHDTDKAYRQAEEIRDMVASSLQLLPELEQLAELAAVDGPSPRRVREERTRATFPGASNEAIARAVESSNALNDDAAGQLNHATPASDRLEAHDTVESLEDFGKLGEERDEAFTRALELRRKGVTASVASIGNAVREVAGMAHRLADHCRSRGGLHESDATSPLELEELTQHAARYLLAVRGLEDLLRLAASDG